MKFIIEGFNEAAGFNGGVPFDFGEQGPDGPDSNYQSVEWKLVHDIVEEKIPGKGHRHVTIRTSDVYVDGDNGTGPLWEATFVVVCITLKRFEKIRELAELGGPFFVTSIFGKKKMYCPQPSFKQDSGQAEDPLTVYSPSEQGAFSVGDADMVGMVPACIGTWTLQFKEYND